jgi:hypothetical protein
VALTGWLLDKSAAARASDPVIGGQLSELAGQLHVCRSVARAALFSALR